MERSRAHSFQEYANHEASLWGIEGRLILNSNLLQEVVNARLVIGCCQDVALSLRQQSVLPSAPSLPHLLLKSLDVGQ